MVWGCKSRDDKLDLVTIQGRLTGRRYIDEVLQPVVVPHFDNIHLHLGLYSWMPSVQGSYGISPTERHCNISLAGKKPRS